MSLGRAGVGVFTTDRSLVVQTWDPWMAEVTGISESAACGEPLVQLYPELAERGLLARLRRVAEGLGVDVLAPALHKYFLPCPPVDRSSRFEHMRQHVTLAPLRDHDGIVGVIVTIEDVTARSDRDSRLAADLDSPEDSVRLRAATELATHGDAPSLLSNALTDQSWRVRRVAAEGMAVAGRDVIGTLIEALREHHRNPALLNAALTALARTREDVVMAIVPLLEIEDADVRTYAALALGLMEDGRAVPALMACLSDADLNVAFHAIEALGRIGDRRAAETIAAVALRRDFFLSFAALDALAAIGEPSVASQLVPLLDDPLLMSAAAACLGAIGTEEVAIPVAALTTRGEIPVTPIAAALAVMHMRIDTTVGEGALVIDLARSAMTADSARAMIAALSGANDEDLRGLALVLSWLPFEGVDEALAHLLRNDAVRDIAAERLAYRGVAAAPYVEEVTRDGLGAVRRVAALALGRIGSPTSVPVLVELLGEEFETDVVVAAAGALGAIGDRRAFVPLLALMDSPEATVRQAAVAALNSIGDPMMESVVSERLDAESPRVRESAARVAGYFGYDSCLLRMIALCRDTDPLVRRTTVESIANYDQPAAWSAIRETLSSDSDAAVRAAAVRALAQSQSDDLLSALVGAFRDSNLWVRYYAARAVARRGDARADVVAALLDCAVLDKAIPVRIAALDALGSLSPASVLDSLMKLTQDADADVSCAALRTLGRGDAVLTASVLLGALQVGGARQQHAALDALGQQGSAAAHAVHAIGALARLTHNDDLRRHAVRALGEIGDYSAIQEVVSLGAARRFREVTTDALAALPEDGMSVLQQVLGSASDDGREMIVDAIGRTKHAGAGRMLAAALDDSSPGVRFGAARGLSRRDLRTARAQLAAIAGTDESPAVRAAAHDALARG